MDNSAVSPMGVTIEKLVEMIKHTTNFHMSVSDLTPNVKTPVFISALIELLHKLGIDREAIVAPPPEDDRDEHTEYYWDLIPIINITRILNQILSDVQQQDNFKVKMLQILNPMQTPAQSILVLLTNLVSFYVSRREAIEPKEMEIFHQRDQVAALEIERVQLVDQLNEQATEKGSRSLRLQKMEESKQYLTEELKHQKQCYEGEVRDLEQATARNEELQAQLDKRRLQRDALLAELARVKAHKVNDAEDIKAQHEQAVRLEKEVTQRLESLKEMLVQKETAAKNLHAVKSELSEGIQYAHEITALTKTLREVTLSSNREQTELEAAVTERSTAVQEAESSLQELRSQLNEIRQLKHKDAAAGKQAVAKAHRLLKECAEAVRAATERAAAASAELPELRADIGRRAATKHTLEQELEDIRNDFADQLESCEALIVQECKRAARVMEEKLGKLGRR